MKWSTVIGTESFEFYHYHYDDCNEIEIMIALRLSGTPPTDCSLYSRLTM